MVYNGVFHDLSGENGEVSKSKVVAVMEMFELDHRSALELLSEVGCFDETSCKAVKLSA